MIKWLIVVYYECVLTMGMGTTNQPTRRSYWTWDGTKLAEPVSIAYFFYISSARETATILMDLFLYTYSYPA